MQDRFRKRIRLSDWDYAQSAVYMVTICIADRTHRFGKISDASEMVLNDAGRMVEQELVRIPEEFADVELDAFVVMPNHVHFLVGIRRLGNGPQVASLGSIVGAFKSRTTNRYIRGVKMGLLPQFDRHLWQRDFYETIMRNEHWANQRREYIEANPVNWRDDPEMN